MRPVAESHLRRSDVSQDSKKIEKTKGRGPPPSFAIGGLGQPAHDLVFYQIIALAQRHENAIRLHRLSENG